MRLLKARDCGWLQKLLLLLHASSILKSKILILDYEKERRVGHVSKTITNTSDVSFKKDDEFLRMALALGKT